MLVLKLTEAIAIIIIVVVVAGAIGLGYVESTWQATEYSGNVASFGVEQVAPSWEVFPIPGNTTYYGMTVVLYNGTAVHAELNGRCIINGFGVGAPVYLNYNTGIWNGQDGWTVAAPLTNYCQGWP